MTRPKRSDEPIHLTKPELLRALSEDDAVKTLMQTLLQEVLEAEMDQALLAGKDERTAGRLGWADLGDAGRFRSTLTEVAGTIDTANLRQAHAGIEAVNARGKIALERFGSPTTS